MHSTDGISGWRKSSFSGYNTNCVEVGILKGNIGIRDSKNPKGGTLKLTAAEWNSFLGSIRATGNRGAAGR